MTELLWGNFTPQHFITLALVPIVCVLLYFITKKMIEKSGTIMLFVLSLWGIAAIIYNLVSWNAPLEYLPFHLCSINALILPIALLTKNQVLGNMMPILSVGALMAIVLNNNMADANMFSWVFVMYYVPHLFEFSIPVVMIATKRIKFKTKYILPVIISIAGLVISVHFINLGLNNYFVANGLETRVNYMYTVGHNGLPILYQLWSLFPYPFFYMLPLLPLIALILYLCNLPNIIRAKKAKEIKEKP